jgi:hypothetical protein
VQDQVGAPTWCRFLAQATTQVMVEVQRRLECIANTVVFTT